MIAGIDWGSRENWALSIGGAMAALFALLVFVVSPLHAHFASRAEALQHRWDAAERYRNSVNDLPQLRIAAEELREETGDGPLLLEGASDALSAANLQSRLKDLIEEQGARLVSAQTLQPAAEGRFHRVGLRVAFSGNLATLTAILLGIVTARPVLSIDNFDLRAAGADDDPMLSAAMDVYGFRAQ